MSYSLDSSLDSLRPSSPAKRGRTTRRHEESIGHMNGRPDSSKSFSTQRSMRQEERSNRIDRGKRRRRGSRSPDDRGRHRTSDSSWNQKRIKSPSDSRDRSQVIRNRKSMTPSVPNRPPEGIERRHGRPSFDHHSSYSDDHDRYDSSIRTGNGDVSATSLSSRPGGISRERSLSPFSKRLALTQALNMNR